MKKIISLIFSAIILVTSITYLSGCGCDNGEISSSKPRTDIVGDWGGRSDDVEVEFNDDGTCKIGGVNGIYEIDDDKTLTVTPKSKKDNSSSNSTKPMIFEYYSSNNISSIPSNQWTISNGTLYINGYQYTKESNSSVTSNIENSGNQNNNNSSSQSSSSSNTNSSSINQSSSSSSFENSSSNSSTSDEQEDNMVTIYENLDNF